MREIKTMVSSKKARYLWISFLCIREAIDDMSYMFQRSVHTHTHTHVRAHWHPGRMWLC